MNEAIAQRAHAVGLGRAYETIAADTSSGRMLEGILYALVCYLEETDTVLTSEAAARQSAGAA